MTTSNTFVSFAFEIKKQREKKPEVILLIKYNKKKNNNLLLHQLQPEADVIQYM